MWLRRGRVSVGVGCARGFDGVLVVMWGSLVALLD